jgi:predicted MFS family arabinose efflux permease
VERETSRSSDAGLSRREWLLLLVLAAVQFTHSMDFMVMLPLGPQCRQEFGIDPQAFAYIVAAYGFSAALAGLLAAWFIDRFDRKTALLFLYTGLTAGTLLCAAAPNYGWLMLGRCVAGAFGGIVAAVVLVVIGDAFPEERRGRATGVVMTAFSVASIAGLPVGIVLGNRFGVGAPFGVLGGLSLGILAVAYRVLPPLRGHLGRRRESGAAAWAILARPAHLRAYAFMVLVVMGTFTLAPHFSDFLVHNVGRAKGDLAYVYFCGGLLTFVTLPLIGRLADRFGKRLVFRVMAGCTILVLLVMSNLPVAALAPVLVVTTLYWVVTSGRWVPAMAMITSSVVPEYRGSFMSVNASVQQMACGLAAVVAGAVVSEARGGALTGYAAAGLIAAGSTAVSMVLAGRLRAAEELPETSAAVDPLEDATAPAPSLSGAAGHLPGREGVAGDAVV